MQNKKIVYIDEVMFTFNTFQHKAWYSKNKRFIVPEDKIKIQTTAAIVAVSKEKGLEYYAIHSKSITANEFSRFISHLVQINSSTPFIIF